MSAFKDETINEKLELAIAPLIDVVFLLLIYFMVTSTLKLPELDLGVSLPGVVAPGRPLITPDEQIIEVEKDGRVFLNGTEYGRSGQKELTQLAQTLVKYRKISEAARNNALITIQGADEVAHERIVDVMNACAGAGIKHVSFGMGEE